MVIIYFQRGSALQEPVSGDFQESDHHWPVQPVRYHAAWPANPRKVVIAQSNDEVILDETFHLTPAIYIQNEPTFPGFNPNEEHAFLAGGKIYALRNDLGTASSSEPYVLVQYQNGASEEELWGMLVFEVLQEDPSENLTFNYAAIAGKRLQPPEAFQILDASGACNALSDPEEGAPASAANPNSPSPILRDRLGGLWAYRAGHDGASETVHMKYYYPAQNSFYFPTELYPTGGPEVGSCVPWLDHANGTPGTPQSVTFTVEWPEKVAKMQLGQTLAQTDPWSDKEMKAEALIPVNPEAEEKAPEPI